MIPVALLGVTGRMGSAILPLIASSDDLVLSGALAAPGNAAIGRDLGTMAGGAPAGVAVTSDPERALAGARVAIDFTRPAASVVHAEACARLRCPILIGTTGLTPAQRDALATAALSVPIVLAPNTSVGVTLMLRLAAIAAGALPVHYDACVLDAHHRGKVDAPSGTALALGEAVARARGGTLETSAVDPVAGEARPRTEGTVGFSVVRAGEIVGEHRLLFAGPGERLTITHVAQDRSVFARGALAAARWLAAGRAPGLYGMHDVLGL